MVTEVVSVRRIIRADVSELPDGRYPSVWGGYVVEAVIGGKLYELVTEDGIRTIAAKCIVTIKDGKVTVETV
jgi:hypothetical protein